MFKYIKLEFFLYYTFTILSAHFISSGRLSGDAFYILQDAIKFSQNLDFNELQNILPRRYVIFIYCLSNEPFNDNFNCYVSFFKMLPKFKSTYLPLFEYYPTIMFTI